MSLAVGASLLGTLSGCLSATSSDLSTSDISAEMLVQADGEMTHIFTVLREGGPDSHTYVTVGGEDQLSIDDGYRPLKLKENSLAGYVYYTEDVTTQDAGSLFTILFERSVDAGAQNSTVALPEPFEVTPFEEGTTLSRSTEPLILTWAPASPSEPMHVHLTGSCIERVEHTVQADEGNLIFQPGELVPLEGTEEESCKLSVTLTREREGVADARWAEGSSIAASHVRTLSLTLAP